MQQLAPVDGRWAALTLDAIAEQVHRFVGQLTPEQAQVGGNAGAHRLLATRLTARSQMATRVALDRVNNRYPCFVGPIAAAREADRRVRFEETHAHT